MREVKLKVGWYTADIQVRMETTRDNIARSRILAGVEETKVLPGDESATYFYHPACATCSTGTITIQPPDGEIEGVSADEVANVAVVINVRDITLAQFLELPGEIFQDWAEAVMSENPHLIKRGITDEKKL
jgi:hypothetical protein